MENSQIKADLINKLSLYSFTLSKLDKSYDKVEPVLLSKNSDKKKNKEDKNMNRKNLYFPKGNLKDTLFWCFYILVNTIEEYEFNQMRHFEMEMKLKFDFLEKIRNNWSIIKEFKLKKIDIESNLCSENKISFHSFYSLCILEKINIYLIVDNCAYQFFTSDDDNNEFFIIHKMNNTFGIDLRKGEELKEILKTKYMVINPIKPIRGISYYKIGELRDILNKLKLDENLPGKFNKNMVYNEIKSYFNNYGIIKQN